MTIKVFLYLSSHHPGPEGQKKKIHLFLFHLSPSLTNLGSSLILLPKEPQQNFPTLELNKPLPWGDLLVERTESWESLYSQPLGT